MTSCKNLAPLNKVTYTRVLQNPRKFRLTGVLLQLQKGSAVQSALVMQSVSRLGR